MKRITHALILLLLVSIPAVSTGMPLGWSARLGAAHLGQTERRSDAEDGAVPETAGSNTTKTTVRYLTLVGVPTILLSFAFSAWGWGDRSTWLWANEGYFGKNTYEGGADKTAHMFSHYMVFRASYNIFNYTESGGRAKWYYSTITTSAMGLAIELGDAYAGQNGFAYEDLIVDAVGIGIAALCERFPLVDSFIALSAEYYPTKYFRHRPNKLWLFPDDYSGWKFLINFKLAGFKDLGLDVPDFLRYIMIDVGYYCRGYTKYEQGPSKYVSSYANPEKKQNLFIGVSLNVAELIKDMYRDKNSLSCRAMQQPFRYYHLPISKNYDFELH